MVSIVARLKSSTSPQLQELLADFAWLVRRTAVQLGAPGLLGIALLGVSGWLVCVELPKKTAALEAIESDLARLQRDQRQPVAATVQPRDPLELVRLQLEPQERFTNVVDDLNTLFGVANLTLVDATLGTPSPLKTLPTIGRIDMAVYARGPYASIKSAVGTLLERYPGLGLEQMVLERNEAASTTLDAHLRFVYFFRR